MNATPETQTPATPLLQAVEATGTIEGDSVKFDAPLPSGISGRVRVLMILAPNGATGQNGAMAPNAKEETDYDTSELTPEQWAYGTARLMAADLSDPAEDIYTLEDGEPFDASQY